MITLTRSSANELYAAACYAVLAHGQESQPRGMATTEVIGAHLCLTQPRRRYVDLPPFRLLNPAFAVAEALWILTGSDDPWIYTYNRSLARYADDGRLQGAYGPRMRRWRGGIDQLAHVRDLLTRDPDSRQAVIQLYDPQHDTLGHRDVPCTLNYRFFLRRGRLGMHTTMRSNDVWLGLPYDLFTATILHELMAGWLGAELGDYHHHVDSLHLYAEHYDAAGMIARSTPEPSPPMPELQAPADDLTGFLDAVIAGQVPAGVGESWAQFGAILASYRGWADGDRIGARAAAAVTGGLLGDALRRWYSHLNAKAVIAQSVAGGTR